MRPGSASHPERHAFGTGQRCSLCAEAGGEPLWEDLRCRVVRVDGPEGIDYPGFCRVIWKAHVREMTDLESSDRHHLMSVVFATESALRKLYAPEKINLASLGNLVPHLHWHVIPRYRDDPQFPSPIWGEVKVSEVLGRARPHAPDQTLTEAISLALLQQNGNDQ